MKYVSNYDVQGLTTGRIYKADENNIEFKDDTGCRRSVRLLKEKGIISEYKPSPLKEVKKWMCVRSCSDLTVGKVYYSREEDENEILDDAGDIRKVSLLRTKGALEETEQKEPGKYYECVQICVDMTPGKIYYSEDGKVFLDDAGDPRDVPSKEKIGMLVEVDPSCPVSPLEFTTDISRAREHASEPMWLEWEPDNGPSVIHQIIALKLNDSPFVFQVRLDNSKEFWVHKDTVKGIIIRSRKG